VRQHPVTGTIKNIKVEVGEKVVDFHIEKTIPFGAKSVKRYLISLFFQAQ
jgi:hypothetical protein